MRTINITEEPLFNSLLEIKDLNDFVDLHNDFDVNSVSYEAANEQLKLKLNSSNKSIELVFDNVEIIEFSIHIQDKTIDNFYRGRYEIRNELFEEYKDKKCFYIDFDEGGKINLLCKTAEIIII